MSSDEFIKEELKRHERWLEKHDKIYGEIKDLTIQIKETVKEIKYIREEQGELKISFTKIDDRVKQIENKPKQRYEDIVKQIISFLIIGVLTMSQ